MIREISNALTDVVVTAASLVSGTCQAVTPLVSAITHITTAAELYAAELEKDAAFDAEVAEEERKTRRAAFASKRAERKTK